MALNDIPLNVDQDGMILVLVLDADGAPVTDLAAATTTCRAFLKDGQLSVTPYTIDLETSDHGLDDTLAADGIYGVPFPAELDDGSFALTINPVEIFVTLSATGAYGFAGNTVIDPNDPLGLTIAANQVAQNGSPVGDPDGSGRIPVTVQHIDDAVMQEQADLTQLYDVTINDDVSPAITTVRRRSDNGIVATWETTLEERAAITSMVAASP